MSATQAQQPGAPVRLSLPPDLSRLPEVRDWAWEAGTSASLPDARIFDLQVTVSEATANAIEHAASAVELTAWLLPDRLLVEITNDGVFRPGLYKDHDGRRRGLGLPLIVSLADQVHVSRLGDSATRVSLTFFLSGGSAVMPTTAAGPALDSGSDAGRPPLALWLLLGAFVVAVAVLAPLRQGGVYNPAGVFTAANIIFLTLVSLFVSVLSARAYLRDRPPSVLLIGCGTLALGLGALLAAVHAGGPGTNPIPATYNTAALLAGVCYLGAAFWVRPTFHTRRSLRPWVLAASFGGVVILLVLLVVLIRAGVWPLYFVQGQGQTTLGSTVARTSALLLAVSAIAIMFAPGAVDVALRRWYGIGLGMIAVGLAAVSLQLALGDPLNWLGRAAQYVGCLVILAGIVYSARRSGIWVLPLERALAESEARYRNLVDLSPDGILVDAEGKHLFANPAAARLLGFNSPEELIGANLMDHVHSEDREAVEQGVSQIMAGAVGPPREVRFVRADGSDVWAEVTGSRVEFQGRLAVQAVLRDITERRLAEEREEVQRQLLLTAQKEQDLLFSEMLDGWAVHEIILDGHGRPCDYRFLAVNPAFERLTGLHAADIIGKTALEVIPGLEHSWIEKYGRVALTGEEAHFESNAEALDRFYEVTAYRPEEGRFATIFHDITERKRAEEALRQSEKSLVRGEGIARTGNWEWDLLTGELRWSAGLYAIYGVDPATFRPTIEAFGEYVHPDDREAVNEVVSRCITEDGSVDFDFRIILADGSVRHVRTRGEVVEFDCDGRPRLMVGVNQDITERKRAEEVLSKNLAVLEKSQEIAHLGSWTVDWDTGVFEASDEDYRIYGLKPGTPTFMDDVWGMIHPDDLDSYREYVESVRLEGRLGALDYRIVRPDGSLRHLQAITDRVVRDAQGRILSALGITQDVTERKQAEEALRESEERYRTIAETLQLALVNIPSEIGPVRFGHLYRSATEAARVGGDFYDVFEVKEGKIALLIGDVAGHGIEAARTATLVKDVVHAFIHQTLRTHEVLKRTNRLLIEKDLPGFVTLFLGILDTQTGELRYSSAGHPDMLVRKASGEVEHLGAGSSPLGIYVDAVWKPHAIELEADDLLVLFTDGVIEARRNGELFGEKRLEVLLKRKRISAERLPQVIFDQVLAFSEGALRDDLAILALRLTAKAEAAASKKTSSTQAKLLGC